MGTPSPSSASFVSSPFCFLSGLQPLPLGGRLPRPRSLRSLQPGLWPSSRFQRLAFGGMVSTIAVREPLRASSANAGWKPVPITGWKPVPRNAQAGSPCYGGDATPHFLGLLHPLAVFALFLLSGCISSNRIAGLLDTGRPARSPSSLIHVVHPVWARDFSLDRVLSRDYSGT